LRETLDGLMREADRLDQRVRTLLEFSRPFEPRVQPTAVEPVLQAVASALASTAAARGVALETFEAPALPRVAVDPDYLEEALLELGGNALRATPAGGTLAFAATHEGRRVVVRVRDSGPGVPEGVRPRLFEPFFTTRADGTGMGLPTVRKVIERMGGAVALESTGPEGTVFRLELPLAPA
jgi:two-component system sensor histidine kinase HydH